MQIHVIGQIIDIDYSKATVYTNSKFKLFKISSWKLIYQKFQTLN